MSDRLTPTAEVLTAARRWARAWAKASAPTIPEGVVGQRMQTLSQAEAALLAAVDRLDAKGEGSSVAPA